MKPYDPKFPKGDPVDAILEEYSAKRAASDTARSFPLRAPDED